MLEKKYIQKSSLSYTALVLIVKKFNKKLVICVNYRALNALIIKNQNALPLIKKTLSRLYNTRIYSKFDVITIFNKIRIKKKIKKKLHSL